MLESLVSDLKVIGMIFAVLYIAAWLHNLIAGPPK